MDPFYILNLQSTLSLVAFALLAKWYIAPRLAQMQLEDALVPLLWIHVFRYTPMTILVPGQVDDALPRDVASAIAYGDLIACVLALIAVLFLRYRLPGSLLVAWVFNIVGLGDIAFAMWKGIGARLYTYPLGFNWYILNFYVPVLLVTHIMMVHRLVKKPR